MKGIEIVLTDQPLQVIAITSKNGRITAYFHDISGMVTEGDTIEEAKKNLMNLLNTVIGVEYLKIDRMVVSEYSEKDFAGK